MTIKICPVSRNDMVNNIIRQCLDSGLHPDEKKMRQILGRASMDDLGRIYDAFFRFGVKEVLGAVC